MWCLASNELSILDQLELSERSPKKRQLFTFHRRKLKKSLDSV